MGFWGSVGKFAGKTALGIIAPGALAGYEYQKAKQRSEAFAEYDEALDTFFKSIAQASEEDGWSELLVVLRNTVVGVLKNDKARKEAEGMLHPEDYARVCATIITYVYDLPKVVQFATQRNVNIDILKGVVNIVLLAGAEFDKRVDAAGMSPLEASLMRLIYDCVCSRYPHMMLLLYGKTKDFVSMQDGVLDYIFTGQEKVVKLLADQNKVDVAVIRHKMGK